MTYNRLLHLYQQTGSIPPCQFTSAQLETVLRSVDAYAAQYFADFTNAISNALGQRAAGVCSPKSAGSSATSAGSAVRYPPLRLGPVTAATGAGVPEPIVILAVLGGLLALLGAIGWAARLRGWDAPWASEWSHAWNEAGYRIGGAWDELADRRRSPRRRACASQAGASQARLIPRPL